MGLGTGSEQAEIRLSEIREWLKERHVGQAFQPAMNLPELRSLSRTDIRAIAFSKRRLPHWELTGSTYFVTFRVVKSLGKVFEDHALAVLLEEVLWFGYGERYALQAYVIMPDHIHMLLRPAPEWSLARILQGIKGFAARRLNKSLGRRGAFWQDERFDHLIRNEHDWLDKFAYIHENPVNARLASKPQDYPFSSLVTIYSQGRLESLPHNTGM